MFSKIGVGIVTHARLTPKKHSFRYKVFQPLFDLDEMPALLKPRWFWSYEKRNIANFRRRDYYGDENVPLKETIQQVANEQLGLSLTGRVELLANLRYFGLGFNPICMYFLYDDDNVLRACVSEVSNTPWNEKVCYAMLVTDPALPGPADDKYNWTHRNDKQMHVSPFMPMDMEYRWCIQKTVNNVNITIENWKEGSKALVATMSLALEPATGRKLNRTLVRFPFMTLKVVLAIYWQAVKLVAKRLTVFDHPGEALPAETNSKAGNKISDAPKGKPNNE